MTTDRPTRRAANRSRPLANDPDDSDATENNQDEMSVDESSEDEYAPSNSGNDRPSEETPADRASESDSSLRAELVSNASGSAAAAEPPAVAPRAQAPRTRQGPMTEEERRINLERQYRERISRQYDQLFQQHAELQGVWQRLTDQETPEAPTANALPVADLQLTLLPFQREGVAWMLGQEASEYRGGILADEMGMGKTIQMLALMLSEPRQPPNLVVCPTVALLQWRNEIEAHTTPGLLKVYVFHGTQRTDNVDELRACDVVLTTYSMIETSFRRERYGTKRAWGERSYQTSVLHAVEWGRIVLDEAHSIKDRSSSTARACFALRGRLKWALSGTPLQNRVGELYSQIRFLQITPFCQYFCKQCPCVSPSWDFSDYRSCDHCGHRAMTHFNYWNLEILKPIQRYGARSEGGVSLRKLRLLLDRIMLRRTKLERAEDLGLPPRVVTIRRDVFNAAEEDVYRSLYSDTRRVFDTYVQANTVLNHYANIFELLMKMRQAVNHPDLVLARASGPNGVAAAKHGYCAICNEEGEDAIRSRCKHLFCRVCVTEYLDTVADSDRAQCPSCYKPLSIDLTQPAVVLRDLAGPAAQRNVKTSILNRIDLSRWRSSTKIEALVEELTRLQSTDSTIKSLVFSQFVNFLDLVQWRLQRAGFNCVKIDGRMDPQQRDAVISAFTNDPLITVFLVSLKAGGVALNLTAASHVFILDPWWNPAVEDQAYDRIHRLGQYRPIHITRLIIENSIESRIIALQEKKKALFQSTIGRDAAALARLTIDDLRFLFVS